MAKIRDLTPAEQVELDRWIATRPPVVQELCRRFKINHLYWFRTIGERVTICGLGEDGIVIVDVSGEFNRIMFNHRVFGINPDDLKECDLPMPDEPLGAILTDDADIERFVEQERRAHHAQEN